MGGPCGAVGSGQPAALDVCLPSAMRRPSMTLAEQPWAGAKPQPWSIPWPHISPGLLPVTGASSCDSHTAWDWVTACGPGIHELGTAAPCPALLACLLPLVHNALVLHAWHTAPVLQLLRTWAESSSSLNPCQVTAWRMEQRARAGEVLLAQAQELCPTTAPMPVLQRRCGGDGAAGCLQPGWPGSSNHCVLLSRV